MEVAQHHQSVLIKPSPSSSVNDLAFAKCECCGLTEECTEEYIKGIQARYSGRWICGLCGEAVKDELARSNAIEITIEEALDKHMGFCRGSNTRLSGLSPPKEQLISAVKQLLLKSLDSPRSSPVKRKVVTKPETVVLARCESCFPALDV